MSQPLQQLADCLQQLSVRPQDGGLWCKVGFLYLSIHEPGEALATFQAAQQIAPGLGEAWFGESIARLRLGEAQAALTAIEAAIARAPGDQRLYSAKAYLLQTSGNDPATVLAAYRDWGRRFADPLARPRPKLRRPGGKIRLGYLSADFRQHALMDFFAPVLEHHDREQFELIAFFSGQADASTVNIKTRFDYWNDVHQLNDKQLAQLIERRGIDILIDLSGHSAGTRLLAVARRPAPIQLTWFGYNGTSGLSVLDGRLSDPVMDPPGNEQWASEAIIRLPHFACFAPPPDSAPPGPAPCLKNGYVTFGSLNNVQKISSATLHAWRDILAAVPSARLRLIGPFTPEAGAGAGAHWRQHLAAHGLPDERVDLLPQQALADFYRLGDAIDIALEPFPLTGAVTTAQALWMGLPCLTLAGTLPAERAAAAILAAANLPAGIVDRKTSYIEHAIHWASDPATLDQLRQGLRLHLQASPLLDHAGFTRALEATLLEFIAQHAPC